MTARGAPPWLTSARRISTAREASATAFVAMKPAVLKALATNPKGDPLEVARLAGIMAAKRTPELIPMCHSLPLSHVAVDMRVCENGVSIACKSEDHGRQPGWRWKRWLPPASLP